MDSKEILKLISDKKKTKYDGRKYYYYKPEEKPGRIDFYGDGKFGSKEVEDTREVYTNWFKVLVNQKIDYSLSKPVTVDKNIPKEFNIEDIVDKLALNASLDSNSWLHIIINDANKLDWVIVDDCEIIPLYDKHKKYIKAVIRYWEVKEKPDTDDSKIITFVQIWTPETLTEMQIKEGKIIYQETKPHYLEVLKYQDKETEQNPKSFGFVPFIPLHNNKNCESDIEDLRELLDVYNEIATGFIKNVRKFQEMIMKLRGYGGQDLEEFTKQLKKYNVIPVDENGDFDYVSVEIPVEARKVLLDIVKKNIFFMGRGVDPEMDFGGGNITNVLIKSKYANLDMKNSDMEKQIRLFYKQLCVILTLYYKLSIDDDITFNRSQIFNETETIDNCMKSMGMISNKTILKKHPWVEDVEDELKRLEKEKEEMPDIDDTLMIPGDKKNAAKIL